MEVLQLGSNSFITCKSITVVLAVSLVVDVSVDGVGGRLAEDEHADCDHEDSIKHQSVPATDKFHL